MFRAILIINGPGYCTVLEMSGMLTEDVTVADKVVSGLDGEGIAVAEEK